MVAMGLSACIVALLLVSVGLLMDIAAYSPKNEGEISAALTVLIERKPAVKVAERPPDIDEDEYSASEDPVEPGVPSVTRSRGAPRETHVAPDKPQPKSDWYAIGEQVAKSTVRDYFEQKDYRAALWRRSPTVMFDPGEERVFQAEDPVIADFRFVPEIHVLGLGITIGSCFIGLPFAGVPVDQRSTLITLFVCAEGS